MAARKTPKGEEVLPTHAAVERDRGPGPDDAKTIVSHWTKPEETP